MGRNTENVNISLENAMKILTETSKLCVKIKAKKTYKRIKKSSNKKWFDCECRLKRHELRKVSNEKHRDPLNSEVRERYHKTLNDYKKLLDTKKREFHKEKTLQLDELAINPDKAPFCNCSNSMNDTLNENIPTPISEESWLDHFKSLHSIDPRNSTRENEIYREHERNSLTISTVRQLRGKYLSSGEEIKKIRNHKILSEMIKASLEPLMPVYIKLFNLILQSGKMPDVWCQGLITPIYKSVDKKERPNKLQRHMCF